MIGDATTDILDDVPIDPISAMDERIRILVARAIYRYPSLKGYARDRGSPIRISVEHGNVTLFGAVDSKGDRDLAYLQATSVPDVVTVTNELRIRNDKPTRRK